MPALVISTRATNIMAAMSKITCGFRNKAEEM
jgi:hypothetical protein